MSRLDLKIVIDLDAVGRGKGSRLEKMLRNMPVAVSSAFIDQATGQIRPVSFGISNETITPLNAEAVKTYFKNVPTTLLEAQGTYSPIKPKRVAVLFSGGPASGGHNVVLGLREALGKDSIFLTVKDGPKGLMAGKLNTISDAEFADGRNQGGFHLLEMGSDRTKLRGSVIDQVRKVVIDNDLDAIVIIGGDDSNTNAMELAEALHDLKTTVVGVPKTIDGDLQVGEFVPISFGYDTAVRNYAAQVGNFGTDAPSGGKYWHVIKVMGRSASHVALGVALEVQPQVAFISEEAEALKMTLDDVATQMAYSVAYRAGKGMNYGVAVIPEGLIEKIPELNILIDLFSQVTRCATVTKTDIFPQFEALKDQFMPLFSKDDAKSKELFFKDTVTIDQFLELVDANNLPTELVDTLFKALVSTRAVELAELPNNFEKRKYISKILGDEATVKLMLEGKGIEGNLLSHKQLFDRLPESVVDAMFLGRDDHGNLLVAQIPTEKLVIEITDQKLKEMKANPQNYFATGDYLLSAAEIEAFKKSKFTTNPDYQGYAGRTTHPTRFDMAYGYNLGLTAGSLVLGEHTGMMAAVSEIDRGGKPMGIPISSLVDVEVRKGVPTPVLAKAYVKLTDPAFIKFKENRLAWSKDHQPLSPGHYQWSVPHGPEVTDEDRKLPYLLPETVRLNHGLQDTFDLGEERQI